MTREHRNTGTGNSRRGFAAFFNLISFPLKAGEHRNRELQKRFWDILLFVTYFGFFLFTYLMGHN
jgi:hypothetical protein